MLVSIGFLHNFFIIFREFSTRVNRDREKMYVKKGSIDRELFEDLVETKKHTHFSFYEAASSEKKVR